MDFQMHLGKDEGLMPLLALENPSLKGAAPASSGIRWFRRDEFSFPWAESYSVTSADWKSK